MTGPRSDYWDARFRAEGRIWGTIPSTTAGHALSLFRDHGVTSVLVPGAGYGRNTRLFSGAGMTVIGIEISTVACDLAREFDPESRFFNAPFLDMDFDTTIYDAVYCFNVLHLFPAEERRRIVRQCVDRLKPGGLLYFAVFSELEESYGKGRQTEPGSFETKPGRPVHYFTEADLKGHFPGTDILETGLARDEEDHGDGPHTHVLRYICARTGNT